MCLLKKAGATFVKVGECNNESVAVIQNLKTDLTGYFTKQPIKVAWNPITVDSNTGMYLVLKDVTNGRAYKSIKIDPSAGEATIETDHFCNDFFSDAIDGACTSLWQQVHKTDFYVEAVLYTPKNYCFGYCATRGGPLNIINKAKTNSFGLNGVEVLRNKSTADTHNCPAGYGWCEAGPAGYSCVLLQADGSCSHVL